MRGGGLVGGARGTFGAVPRVVCEGQLGVSLIFMSSFPVSVQRQVSCLVLDRARAHARPDLRPASSTAASTVSLHDEPRRRRQPKPPPAKRLCYCLVVAPADP